MPLITVSNGTTFNLQELLDGTVAGASRTDANSPELVSRIIITCIGAGTVYLARNHQGVSTTDYDIILAPEAVFDDALHIAGNAIAPREWYLVVSAASTVFSVYIAPH